MSQSRRDTARSPELPRVYLDTRMPPAPAPGGRVIIVGMPTPRRSRVNVALGALVVGLAVLGVVLLRWSRHARSG